VRSVRSFLSAVSAVSALSACNGSAQTARVILPPGASFGAVTDSLKAHGVITNPRWFKLMARIRGVDRSVHAGVYEFPAGTPPWTVLGMLAHGKKAAAGIHQALQGTAPVGERRDFVLHVRDVAARVKVLMQQILDRYKAGINITTVDLQGVQAPEQVQAAFEDVVRAGQDRERFKNEGQAYANDVVPKAQGVKSRYLEEANGYKQAVISTAQGDASRFRAILAEYERAPQVTRERIYLDTLQQILSATSKVIVDQKSGANLLYLPLDRIMQMATQPQGSTVTIDTSRALPEASSPPVVQEPITSRRDSLRSRDREAGR